MSATYAAPSVSSAGLVVSTYEAILADNLQSYLNIYGQNQYVGVDSAIYQLLSIISLKQSDVSLAAQLAYNQSSPVTAVGAGLDRAVKMNGLARNAYTYSSAVLTLTGSGTITNGYAQDQNGNLWALPSPTTITGGSSNVTATCTTPGNVTAEAGAINIISTPTSGWLSVTNLSAATPGNATEADSALRARQAISVALPALTPIGATVAALLAVAGVNRVAPGYATPSGPGTSIENPTGSVDYWGNPPHSITMVVEGGANSDVATAIYLKKTIGCLTNGTTSVVVTDPNTSNTETISFYRPTPLAICVLISVHGLSGFTSTTQTAIQTGLVDYLNSLDIGEAVVYSELYGAALTARSNPDQPTFSIRALTSGAQATQTTATLNGTNVISVTSASGIAVGQVVVDESHPTALPSGVTVASIAGTDITLSGVATASYAGDTVAFFTMGASDITLAFYQAASGAAANVVVSQV